MQLQHVTIICDEQLAAEIVDFALRLPIVEIHIAAVGAGVQRFQPFKPPKKLKAPRRGPTAKKVLSTRFGIGDEFTIADAKEFNWQNHGINPAATRAEIERLCVKGYLSRVDHGRYRVDKAIPERRSRSKPDELDGGV